MKGLSKGRYDETFAGEDGFQLESIESIGEAHLNFPCTIVYISAIFFNFTK